MPDRSNLSEKSVKLVDDVTVYGVVIVLSKVKLNEYGRSDTSIYEERYFFVFYFRSCHRIRSEYG